MSEERGFNFPAMTVVGREYEFVEEKLRLELEGRTLGINALPVIFPIMGSATLNSQIAVFFRTALQRKLWNFLIPEGDAETWLIRNQKEFMKDSNDSSYSFFLSPYLQTNFLVTECSSLDRLPMQNGLIRLQERSGNYKDRYSSVSYANWVISQFDKELLRESQEQDNYSVFESMTMVF